MTSLVNGVAGAAAPEKNPVRRFLMVDALRGCAAVAVVLHHVWNRNLSPDLNLLLPEPFETIVSGGYLGVPIFFVLSGFVIAHSTFGADHARVFRQVRLAPLGPA